jgi:hypothetical protein
MCIKYVSLFETIFKAFSIYFMKMIGSHCVSHTIRVPQFAIPKPSSNYEIRKNTFENSLSVFVLNWTPKLEQKPYYETL